MGCFSLATVLIIAVLAISECTGNDVPSRNYLLGSPCGKAGVPTGPGGSWQSVGERVNCPDGSSCRKGACNCDDLEDGTVMSISSNRYEKSCRRIAGESCEEDWECFHSSRCIRGICVCSNAKGTFCVDFKREAAIYN